MAKGLILIAGIPAAGKSTFARALSEKFHIPSFCKDNLNETIGNYMALPDRDARAQLSVASVRVLLHIADRILSCGHPVILESNFKPNETAAVRELIETHACPALTFVFSGDMRSVFDRFTARENSAERNAIHKSHGLHDLETFRNAVSPLAAFDVGGLRLCVDATDFHLVDFDALFAAAENFLSAL